jgi:Co/Zn/Cd efflux system component
MLITALIGLACNIVNVFTLHSCGGGHSHHHVEEDAVEDKLERKLSHCH